MVQETLNILVNADTKAAEAKLGELKGLASGISMLGGVAFLKESVDAWKTQEEAVVKLDAAVSTHQKNMQGHSSKQLQDIASQTQAITTYGDEATMVADENFLTFGATYDQIKALQKPMSDLTAHQKGIKAGGQDFLDISNQIGKAWMNGAGALKKSGTLTAEQADAIDKISDKNERLKALTGAIEANYGKQAENLRKSGSGQWQAAMNNWGDKMEEVGAKILPKLVQGMDFIGKHFDTIVKIGEAFAAWKISSMLMGSVKALSGNLTTIAAKTAQGGGSINGVMSKGANFAAKGLTVAGGVAGVAASTQAGGGWTGGLSGAMAGATAGSILGPWGMAGGAAIGGLIGAFGPTINTALHLDGKKVAETTSKHKLGASGNHNAST